MNMILVGSTYFFSNCENFASKDKDFVDFVKSGNGFKYIKEIHGKNYRKFILVERPKSELIEYALTCGPAMQLGKFLIPEFAEVIGLTIDDLKLLEPLRDKLDAKYQYEKIIFDAYIENGEFKLTDEQLANAYDEYVKCRVTTPATPTAPEHEMSPE